MGSFIGYIEYEGEKIPQSLVTLLLSPCKVARSVASAKPKARVIESLRC